MFETPETYRQWETREQCTSCLGSGRRPERGGLKGGNFCRRCNGRGYIGTIYNVHRFEVWGVNCYHCGLTEESDVHELQQLRII